jgi:membrane protein insertase Oxa1/YidC/SpoIIIJ
MKDGPVVSAQQQKIRTVMMYGFPIVTLVVMSWQAAIIQLTFTFTSVIIGAQNLILRNAWIRKKLHMAPLGTSGTMDAFSAIQRPAASTETKKGVKITADEIRQQKAKQYESIRKRQQRGMNDKDTRF